MVLVAASYFPSVTSILAALFSVICAPVRKLQDFYISKNLKGVVKSALLVVLFFTAIFAAPTLETSHDSSTADDKQEMEQLADQQTEDDAETAAQEPYNEPLEDVDDGEEVDAEQITADKEPEPSSPAEQEDPQQEASTPVSATAGKATDPASAPENSIEQEQNPAPVATPEPHKNTNSAGKDRRSNWSNGSYLGSSESDKYHDYECRAAKKILPENEVWFYSEEVAQAAGYSRCGICW